MADRHSGDRRLYPVPAPIPSSPFRTRPHQRRPGLSSATVRPAQMRAPASQQQLEDLISNSFRPAAQRFQSSRFAEGRHATALAAHSRFSRGGGLYARRTWCVADRSCQSLLVIIITDPHPLAKPDSGCKLQSGARGVYLTASRFRRAVPLPRSRHLSAPSTATHRQTKSTWNDENCRARH
jgi:hypothetical protein